MRNFYKSYSKKNIGFNKGLKSLSKKQYVALSITFVAFIFAFNNYVFAQSGGGSYVFNGLDVILGNDDSSSYKSFFLSSFNFVDIFLNVLYYISNVQIQTNQNIAAAPLGNSGMFGSIVNVITIFAAVGCAYRIVNHFFRTERYDNVQSFLGFFSYIPILVLFVFSDSIVSFMVSANTNINNDSVSGICEKINNEVENEIRADYNEFKTKQKALDEAYTELGWSDFAPVVKNRWEYLQNSLTYSGLSYFKYIYYVIFGTILATVLAIPTVIMTLMVKILLTIAILGAKIVFLMAFIPGFESAWKTYMLNLLNVLLWIPIFNVIIAFIITLVEATIVDNSLNTGQIVWLSIVAIICAYQSISLTTSSAQMIVSGAGAGMAGALGSMAAMNATSVVAGATGAVVAGGVAIGGAAATGGASAPLSAAAIGKVASSKMPYKE